MSQRKPNGIMAGECNPLMDCSVAADSREMAGLPTQAWMLIGAIIAATVLGVLHILAHMVREDELVWQHRQSVKLLRDEYSRRLQQLKDSGELDLEIDGVTGEVDIVEDEPAKHAA